MAEKGMISPIEIESEENRKKACEMLKKAKQEEYEFTKKNALVRIKIRGGYIMTTRPDLYTDVNTDIKVNNN